MKRTSLFLIELLCNLVLFALCAALCVALLMQARGMSRQSGQLTNAVILAQRVAERWRASGSTPASPTDENGFTYTFSLADDGATITVYQDQQSIYALEGVTRP